MQANGRGDIDLVSYIRVLHQHGYTGALDLEIIGTKGQNTPWKSAASLQPKRAATCRPAYRRVGRA